MAFYDWNGNGKHDMADDWIEYNIYQECQKNNEKSCSGSSPNSSGGLWVTLIIIFVILILAECGA